MLMLVVPIKTLHVWTFDKSSEISEVTLDQQTTEDVPLPDKFILCSSQQLSKMTIEGQGPYTILGQDDKTWFSLSFWYVSPKVMEVWAMASGDKWYLLGTIPRPTFNSWYHICLEFDIKDNQVKIASNGKIMTDWTAIPNMKEQKPTMLNNNFYVGKCKANFVKTWHPFLGSVTNIKMFKTDNSTIENLSGSLCTHQGDLLSGSHSLWRKTGQAKETTLSPGLVCHGPAYDLLLDFKQSQSKAIQMCQRLGRGSTVSTSNDQPELDEFLSWFNGITYDKCSEGVWTPFSDEETEGVFLHNGEKVTFLPWKPGQPNDGIAGNAVVTMGGQYVDMKEDKKYCVSCSIFRTTVFHLRGAKTHDNRGDFI